jgi:hypothetical protein
MFFAEKNKVNSVPVLDTAFLIKCLKFFKTPNSNGHLNAQQQLTLRPFKG